MDNLFTLLITSNFFRKPTPKNIIKNYVDKYSLSKNQRYPYFIENDCTNFISQCICEAGAKQSHGYYGSHDSWFCSTRNSSELILISLSWRTAKYFRIYWANPYTKKYRAHFYQEFSANEALEHFTKLLYEPLDVGDVIQYINQKEDPHPYHTQVIHRKELTNKFPYTNLFVAQHSKDSMDVSLHEYIRQVKDCNETKVCIYKII